MNELTKQTLKQAEKMNTLLPGEGTVKDFGEVIYTLLYLKWITNKDLLYRTWNSTQYYVLAWMGVGLGGEWIHVYVWLSPFTVHLKPSQLC